MEWYIENLATNKKYYYGGYLDAVNDYYKLAERLGVYPAALVIKSKLVKY